MIRARPARRFFSAARVLAAALIAVPFVSIESRAEFGVPPHQVFQAMLAYASEGRYDRVARILDRSEDMVSELESFSGEALAKPLRAAAAAKDAWGVQSAILRLTFQHMRLEFSRAAGGDVQERGRAMRLAYLDFLFLKPRLETRSPKVAAEAEALFRELYEGRERGREDGDRLKFERLAALCGSAFQKG